MHERQLLAVAPLQVAHDASQFVHTPLLSNLLLGQAALHYESSRTVPPVHERQLLLAPPLQVAHDEWHAMQLPPAR